MFPAVRGRFSWSSFMRDLQLLLRYCLFSTLLAVALCVSGAKAQMVGGTISGDVVDSAGAAVGRAEVLVRNDETGSERKFTTADSGTFSAPWSPWAPTPSLFREMVLHLSAARALCSPSVRMSNCTLRSPLAACNRASR